MESIKEQMGVSGDTFSQRRSREMGRSWRTYTVKEVWFVCFQSERLFITCLHADGNDPVKRGKMRREQKRRVEEFQ